jgi:hypothetical protein
MVCVPIFYMLFLSVTLLLPNRTVLYTIEAKVLKPDEPSLV